MNNDRMQPSYWTTEQLRVFVDDALRYFDESEFGFGDVIKITALLQLAELPEVSSSTSMTALGHRDRQLVELRLISAFRDAVLEHRDRCVRQQGALLRVLHPAEQLRYGEEDHCTLALRKLKRGTRIVRHTDTNDVLSKNAAVDRLKSAEAHIRRQITARQHPF